MSPKQVELMKRLISAERTYQNEIRTNGYASRDLRCVEVGKINGVDPKTAQSLVDAGLCDSWNLNEWGSWAVWLKDELWE